MSLELQIEELISQGGSDFEISKLLKKHIKEYLSSLDEIFSQNQGKDFLVKHTKKIDSFIKIVFKYALRKHFGAFLPMQNSIPLTLVALGSYGREQLCVYSDIDLMIVYKPLSGYNIEPIIESILYLAWDSGLKLGHRVHKIEDLFLASNEDSTIKTALIESRFLIGSKFLWTQIQRELNRIRIFKQKEFVYKKIKELEKRHIKFPLNMEPNIKEGAGGLRDANTLYWIANALFYVTKVRDLTPRFISEEEYKEFRGALEFIYRLRSALHLSAGKKQDTLNLEFIPDVAKKLGFLDTKFKNPQRALSQKTLHSLWVIKITSEIFIKKLTRTLRYDSKNFSKLKNGRIKKNLYLCDKTLYASYNKQILKLKEVKNELLMLKDQDIRYDISYINRIKPAIEKNSYELTINFFYREFLFETFYALYKASLLHKIIPPFKKIINLAQFDGYHRYPVDIHSLKALWHLENIEDDFIKSLYTELCADEKAILKLAVFLHDSGKGRKRNHCDVGADIIKVFAKKIGFSNELSNQAALLVKYHTLMSNTANREDIYNEKVIFSFISKLKNLKNLKMLYVLTYCDIKSVDKNVYSPFSAKLLKEFYTICFESFEKEELIDETSRRLRREKALKKDLLFKNLSKTLQKKILFISSNIFFLKYKANEIVDLCRCADSLEKKEFDYKIDNDEHLSISIIRKKELNLGYLLGKLSFLDLASMDIFKLFDGIKYFKIEFLEKIEKEELLYIRELIQDSFDMNKKSSFKKPHIYKNEIKIDFNHSKTYAKMSINTKNQRALMAHFVSVLDEFGIDIATAKVQTIKNRARNLFLIEKNGKFSNNIKKILNLVTICAE